MSGCLRPRPGRKALAPKGPIDFKRTEGGIAFSISLDCTDYVKIYDGKTPRRFPLPDGHNWQLSTWG